MINYKHDVNYIRDMCVEWGDYMRKHPKYWSSRSPSWRLFRDRGAKSQAISAREPKGTLQIFSPEYADVAQIHRIWRGMSEGRSVAMVILYVKKYGKKKKALKLGMTPTAMYELQTNLLHYIEGQLD